MIVSDWAVQVFNYGNDSIESVSIFWRIGSTGDFNEVELAFGNDIDEHESRWGSGLDVELLTQPMSGDNHILRMYTQVVTDQGEIFLDYPSGSASATFGLDCECSGDTPIL